MREHAASDKPVASAISASVKASSFGAISRLNYASSGLAAKGLQKLGAIFLMRPSPAPGVLDRGDRKPYLLGKFLSFALGHGLERGHYVSRRLTFTPRIGIHGIDIVGIRNATLFDLFKLVRLFADEARWPLDRHASPLQEPDGLLAARRSAGIGALGLFVELVLFEHVAVALDACNLSRARRERRANPVVLAAVLIDPRQREPLARVGLVRRDEVKALRIGVGWMPERRNVAAKNAVERLDLLGLSRWPRACSDQPTEASSARLTPGRSSSGSPLRSRKNKA
jgi:hypothetical protein